ncbi:MAG: hypothetical protein EOP61_34670 [Sphingomonadales bacterium]|nr:MAG: hypothetical protein EOP61_34670 [Sphingomonadales bacterium]
MLLTLAAALTSVSPRPQVNLDLGGGGKGHALISLGFASIKLAFDFGHECSNSDSCGGAEL